MSELYTSCPSTNKSLGVNKVEINKQLCLIIKEEDPTKFEDCIRNGADLYARVDYREFYTPWVWVYSCQNFLMMSLILDVENIDLDYPVEDLDGQTIIFGMVFNCCPAIIKFLVFKGANINARDGNNDTPLSYALSLRDECFELVPLLLNLGANINTGNDVISILEKNYPKRLDTFYGYLTESLDTLEREARLDDLKSSAKEVRKLVDYNKVTNVLLLEKLEDVELMLSFEGEADNHESEIKQDISTNEKMTIEGRISVKLDNHKSSLDSEERGEQEIQRTIEKPLKSKDTKIYDFENKETKCEEKETAGTLLPSFEESYILGSTQESEEKNTEDQLLLNLFIKTAGEKSTQTENNFGRFTLSIGADPQKKQEYYQILDILQKDCLRKDGSIGTLRLSDFKYASLLRRDYEDIYFSELFWHLTQYPYNTLNQKWIQIIKEEYNAPWTFEYLTIIRMFLLKYY